MNSDEGQADDLRRRAETAAQRRRGDRDPAELAVNEAARLLHELQVHQIELELQNDELHLAQSRLEAAHARYFELYDLAPVGYATLDAEGLILEANLTLADLLDVGRATLVQQPLTRYILPADQDVFYLHRRGLSGAHQRAECELRLLRADGLDFPALLTCTTARDEVTGALVSRAAVHDLTERRRAECERRDLEQQLHEADKAAGLGVLAGGVAHNFNNLLTAILGYARLAASEYAVWPDLSLYLGEIAAAAEHGAEVCRDLMAYCGRTARFAKPLVLDELLRDMTTELHTIAAEATVSLHLDSGSTCLVADAAMLRQLVRQLVLNASEALGGEAGAITLETAVTTIEQAPAALSDDLAGLTTGRYVRLKIVDTGSGIDAATRQRIFEPFYSTKFAGRGLGLSAVQGIVRMHHGSVAVASEPGRGSTFVVHLPAQLESPAAATTS